MTGHCQRPTATEGLLISIKAGLHSVTLAIELLSESSRQCPSPARSRALLEASLGGIETASEALSSLSALLAQRRPQAEGYLLVAGSPERNTREMRDSTL